MRPLACPLTRFSHIAVAVPKKWISQKIAYPRPFPHQIQRIQAKSVLLFARFSHSETVAAFLNVIPFTFDH